METPLSCKPRLVLGLKECLVECATLCVKIEVILVTKLSRKKN